MVICARDIVMIINLHIGPLYNTSLLNDKKDNNE